MAKRNGITGLPPLIEDFSRDLESRLTQMLETTAVSTARRDAIERSAVTGVLQEGWGAEGTPPSELARHVKAMYGTALESAARRYGWKQTATTPALKWVIPNMNPAAGESAGLYAFTRSAGEGSEDFAVRMGVEPTRADDGTQMTGARLYLDMVAVGEVGSIPLWGAAREAKAAADKLRDRGQHGRTGRSVLTGTRNSPSLMVALSKWSGRKTAQAIMSELVDGITIALELNQRIGESGEEKNPESLQARYEATQAAFDESIVKRTLDDALRVAGATPVREGRARLSAVAKVAERGLRKGLGENWTPMRTTAADFDWQFTWQDRENSYTRSSIEVAVKPVRGTPGAFRVDMIAEIPERSVDGYQVMDLDRIVQRGMQAFSLPPGRVTRRGGFTRIEFDPVGTEDERDVFNGFERFGSYIAFKVQSQAHKVSAAMTEVW